MSSVNVAVATACMGLVWTCMVLNGCFGERSECTCVDVGFFNPFALSIVNVASYLFACYKKHDSIKKGVYGQWVSEIENATFTPVVMSIPLVYWLGHATYFINVRDASTVVGSGRYPPPLRKNSHHSDKIATTTNSSTMQY